MVNAQRKALERLWKDRCTVYHRVKVKDPISKLTDSKEMPLLQDQPCKLSFETLSSTDGDHVSKVAQSVKLFISPDVEIPAGCKIVVKRSITLNGNSLIPKAVKREYSPTIKKSCWNPSKDMPNGPVG